MISKTIRDGFRRGDGPGALLIKGGAVALFSVLSVIAPVRAEAPFGMGAMPILVPVTGFLALEGTSQRNGALLALEDSGLGLSSEVIDTGTSPEAAVTALERAANTIPDRGGRVLAVAASMLGIQMLAMLPLAEDYRLPLITVSGTAAITERGNPWVFRFFPGDGVTKQAHARYVVEELGRRRPAVISQTTAYGQSGRGHLARLLTELGAPPVFDEAIDTSVRDMAPVLTRALATNPDVLVLHLHAAPTALLLRQAAAQGVTLPVVAGSALHQPSTAALLDPATLKGACAETASSPVSGGTAALDRFTAAYRTRFGAEPDAFALGQYDGMTMALNAVRTGANSPEAIRQALADGRHQGLAMSYRSDGKGNMAHGAMIVCYDGHSRIPVPVKSYQFGEN